MHFKTINKSHNIPNLFNKLRNKSKYISENYSLIYFGNFKHFDTTKNRWKIGRELYNDLFALSTLTKFVNPKEQCCKNFLRITWEI